MTSRQKAEALLKELRMPVFQYRLDAIFKALEDEYDEGFQNGMNRAQEDQERESRIPTGPVA